MARAIGEHGDGIFPDQFARIKCDGIIVVQDPVHMAPIVAPGMVAFDRAQPLKSLIAYKLTLAYAEFQEKEKGTIEPGKLADLAMLSQDIFTVPTDELPKTVSVLTMVGGKVIYEAESK